MVRNKGQSATEYLLVVSLALLIIVPGSMIFYSYSLDSKSSLVNSQIFKIGNTLLDVGSEIYSIGDDSWKTIEVSFPEEITNIVIYNGSDISELVIIHGSVIPSESVFFSQIQLCNATDCECSDGCNINFNPGINSIRIISLNGKIHYLVK